MLPPPRPELREDQYPRGYALDPGCAPRFAHSCAKLRGLGVPTFCSEARDWGKAFGEFHALGWT
eukprot:14221643-Alexandrium_andersonii.AAC.1